MKSLIEYCCCKISETQPNINPLEWWKSLVKIDHDLPIPSQCYYCNKISFKNDIHSWNAIGHDTESTFHYFNIFHLNNDVCELCINKYFFDENYKIDDRYEISRLVKCPYTTQHACMAANQNVYGDNECDFTGITFEWTHLASGEMCPFMNWSMCRKLHGF